MLPYPTRMTDADLAEVDCFAAAGVLDDFPRLRMLMTGIAHQERQRRARNADAAEIPREPELTPSRVQSWPTAEVNGATLVLVSWIIISDNKGMRKYLGGIINEVEAEKNTRLIRAIDTARRLRPGTDRQPN